MIDTRLEILFITLIFALLLSAVIGVFNLNSNFIAFSATIRSELDAFSRWAHEINKRVERLETAQMHNNNSNRGYED